MKHRIHPVSAALGGGLVATLFLSFGMRAAPDGLTPEQFEILRHLSLVKLPDGQGNMLLTLRVSEANLQVVNGLGTTPSANGLGNLIVGYNELGPSARSGSHNLVAGTENGYTSSGGIVAGRENELHGSYSTVTGGLGGHANGSCSSVGGGRDNWAESEFSSVTGGQSNHAMGESSTIVGGIENQTSGVSSVVVCGYLNQAEGWGASVSGGSGGTASHNTATVTGGCGTNSTQDCHVVP